MKQQKTQLHITSSRLMNSLFLGNFKAAFSGKGIEFQDFREYSYGDDARYIDWSASSREQTTIIRRYREEKQGNISCVIDVRESLTFENGEKTKVYKNILEILYQACLACGESFGGYILQSNENVCIPSTKSPIALHRLQKLSEKYRDNSSLLNLNFLLRKSVKRGIIFVLSDSMNIDEKSFKAASQKHDIIFISVSSVFENTLSGKKIVSLRSENTGVTIDLADTDKKQLYIKKREEELLGFKRRLKKFGADSIFLDESSSIESEFIKCMKSRV